MAGDSPSSMTVTPWITTNTAGRRQSRDTWALAARRRGSGRNVRSLGASDAGEFDQRNLMAERCRVRRLVFQAKSECMTKLTLSRRDRVRHEGNWHIVFDESNGYAQEISIMVNPPLDSFCCPVGNEQKGHTSYPCSAQRPEHTKHANSHVGYFYTCTCTANRSVCERRQTQHSRSTRRKNHFQAATWGQGADL